MKEEGEADDEEEEKDGERGAVFTFKKATTCRKPPSQPRRPEPTSNELVCGFRLSSSLI